MQTRMSSRIRLLFLDFVDDDRGCGEVRYPLLSHGGHGRRSVGLSVVPKSAADSAAEEMFRAPVSLKLFFARAHHSGVSQ